MVVVMVVMMIMIVMIVMVMAKMMTMIVVLARRTSKPRFFQHLSIHGGSRAVHSGVEQRGS